MSPSSPSSASRGPAKPVKVLVANRSEIAIRVFRAANELGIRTVAIFAHEDRFSMHRFKADEAYQVGEGKGPVAAYLDIDSIIAIAKAHQVTMIHPGYGFLSENADFARACEKAGITFVGPKADLLELMGDKTAARRAAIESGLPVLPGTEEPVVDRKKALKLANQIGFPLIIKAAHGGGGRGMRIVHKAADLEPMLDEARNEAANAFGNSAVFLEKFISRAKHLEVQLLGDRHGNVVHLHERDCSVQRRHQKVVEIAPAIGIDPAITSELCLAAAKLGKKIGYDNAGTVEFLYDMDRSEWFFIEMNPRIQVEHTVTEEITRVDLVRSQMLIAQGHALHSAEVAIPQQDDIPKIGAAVQCRVTTEDPENKFTPDYGKIITYRSASGFGIRLDGGMGDSGSVITPFYDSLLVKITANGPSFKVALQRMHRALREFRIRGVKTNIPFLENVITHPLFVAGGAVTSMIDNSPELFQFKPRRDRATKLLSYLSETIVNGNPHAKGYLPAKPFASAPMPMCDLTTTPPPGTRQRLLELGPKKFAQWTRDQRRLLITDTTFRDAHQSLMATRIRTRDMLAVAPVMARLLPDLYSLEMWGGATFDTAMRFLREDPWERLRELRKAVPNICFQMLFRGSNAVGYSNYPDNVVAGFIRHSAEAGIDIFRIFDSLNYLPNLAVAMEAVQETHAICEGAICYTGNISDPNRAKYDLKYYVDLAKELEKMGAHVLAIKDMAGLCRPASAKQLVKALREEVALPVHFHTHDTSGISAASVLQASDAGVDVVDLAVASMSGSTSQPNMNSIVAALEFEKRKTGLDLDTLNALSDYWEAVRLVYAPFDTAPKTGSAEVYIHEMPGGQYTNLKEQAAGMGLSHRWPEIARCYADVNAALGDIVKVTPSSKVVGDLTMFCISKGIQARDLVNLEPGSTPFPDSVVDMLAGGLGQPLGGWPADLQRVVLGKKKAITERPGENLPPLDLAKTKFDLAAKLRREPSDDDLFSHLMYPQVFAEYAKFVRDHGNVSPLPTHSFFYGLKPDTEISVPIEEGKTLFIRLINIGEPNQEGKRLVNFELNGVPRQSFAIDRSIETRTKARPKANEDLPGEIAAPFPAMVTTMVVSTGTKVAKGDKLLTLEAMKMYTTIESPIDGVISEILVSVGDAIESRDLLLRIKSTKS